MYAKQKTITAPISNNRLDYDKRVRHEIVVPRLTEGTLDDVHIGTTVAIECSTNGQIQSPCGLENFVFLNNARVPTWIIDNHNHAFAFWHEAYWKGYIQTGSLLVHIDQHTDLATPTNFPAWSHPEQTTDILIEEYTNTDLTIADFIVPALATGLIKETLMITGEDKNGVGIFSWGNGELKKKPVNSPLIKGDGEMPEWHFEEGDLMNGRNIIVDLDLDYFAQGFDESKCFETIRFWLEKATIVTIATSPLFIEQTEAIEFVKSLQKDLVTL